MQIDRSLPPEPEAIVEAGRAVDSLAPFLPSQLLEPARWISCELIQNSLKHAKVSSMDDRIRIVVDVNEKRVRIEVSDPGRLSPSPAPTVEPESGLFVIDRMADRWGIAAEHDRPTLAWAELDIEPPSHTSGSEGGANQLTSAADQAQPE